MFTGYHVEEHQLTHNDRGIQPGNSVWEQLSDRGYDTGVFSHNPYLTGGTGLEHGFETVVSTYEHVPYPDAVNPYDYADDYLGFGRAAIADRTPVQSLLNGLVGKFEPEILDGVGNWTAGQTGAQRCVDAFLDWHDTEAGEQWGACLNLMDAHFPYQPGELRYGDEETVALAEELEAESLWQFEGGQRPWSEWEAMEDLYDDCIQDADAAIGNMLDRLEERGALDNTLVIITSDHGEAFGEPSRVRDVRIKEHGSGAIHESILHVPLVVRWPGQTTGTEVDDPVSLTWLASAIDMATSGELNEDPLQRPDTPVLASTHGLATHEIKYEEGTEYVDDMKPFAAHSRAVYEKTDDGIRKYADSVTPSGSRKSVSIRIDDKEDSTVESETDSGRTEDAFADISDAEVRISSVTLDDQMESRLEDLGYM
jgi:arylsulfatase